MYNNKNICMYVNIITRIPTDQRTANTTISIHFKFWGNVLITMYKRTKKDGSKIHL